MRRFLVATLVLLLCVTVPSPAHSVAPADLDNDGSTDLQDVIIALRIMSGLPISADISAYVEQSGSIGLADAIYALQHAACLRDVNCNIAAGHAPVISGLHFFPSSALLGSGENGWVTVYGAFDFFDPCGDIFTLRLQTSTDDLTLPVDGVDGLTSGTGYGAFIVSTAAVGNYNFAVWLTDSKDNASNKLNGAFSVVTKTLDSPGQQPGDLDGAFGTAGKVFYEGPVEPGNDELRAVAVQSDGKIVAVGTVWNGERKAFLLLRYNADGTPDDSFGTKGVVTFNKEIGDDEGFGVAVQADGKIVAVGYSNIFEDYRLEDVLVLRYNSDGTPDAAFGTGGAAVFNIHTYDYGYAVALQPDGKIIVAGKTGTPNDNMALVLRCNADGTLDSGFGKAGIFTYNGPGWDAGYGVALQTDGKIVVTGSSSKAYPETAFTDILLLRLSPDGSPDPAFGNSGIVLYNQIYEEGKAVAIQPDGKIVVAGGIWSYSSYEDMTVVLRYNANGTPDQTFGAGGAVFYSRLEPDYMYGNAVALQPDGKILAAGYLNDQILVLRYTGDGRPDLSFSEDGAGIYSSGGNALGFGIAVQSDGRIVVAGNSSYHDSYSDYAGFLIRIVGR